MYVEENYFGLRWSQVFRKSVLNAIFILYRKTEVSSCGTETYATLNGTRLASCPTTRFFFFVFLHLNSSTARNNSTAELQYCTQEQHIIQPSVQLGRAAKQLLTCHRTKRQQTNSNAVTAATVVSPVQRRGAASFSRVDSLTEHYDQPSPTRQLQKRRAPGSTFLSGNNNSAGAEKRRWPHVQTAVVVPDVSTRARVLGQSAWVYQSRQCDGSWAKTVFRFFLAHATQECTRQSVRRTAKLDTPQSRMIEPTRLKSLSQTLLCGARYQL